jgi:acyl-CoA synthetase (NDP forming)
MPDIHALLWPRHVVLIGASAEVESLRGRLMHTMLSHPFEGQIYPVTRSHAEVLGRKAYASVRDLPQRPDLAVLIIPAPYIPQALEDCGRAGAKAAVVPVLRRPLARTGPGCRPRFAPLPSAMT